MSVTRETTVLFADVSGSTRLYETAGDVKATEAIQDCLLRLREAAVAAGGRVVKTIGDEILALFPVADAAAEAAGAMQKSIETMAEVGGTKLGVRIGFHCGPVIQRDDDVFGDTVNLAARLVQQANKDQIITSAETAAVLGEAYRASMRQLYAIQIKGKSEEVELYELVWRIGNDTATFQTDALRARQKASTLRLRYRDEEILRRREHESIVIGREEDCDLVILHHLVSRHHCSIERRQDKFVLVDQSTNGTYVTVEGDTEVPLHREAFTLRRHGWISFGQPRVDAEDVVEYFCE
jgi:class 3 adenylate cyclase